MEKEKLEKIIKAFKRKRENVRSILEEQGLTLFNSRDYYEGELEELNFIIRVLEASEDSKFLEYFLNSYSNYKVEE
jgi:hypothetical protein